VQILRNDGITIRLAWLNESAVRVDKNEYKQREKKGTQQWSQSAIYLQLMRWRKIEATSDRSKGFSAQKGGTFSSSFRFPFRATDNRHLFPLHCQKKRPIWPSRFMSIRIDLLSRSSSFFLLALPLRNGKNVSRAYRFLSFARAANKNQFV
jgi:hypothetical protein